jgi:hypothetical protein
MIIFITLKRQTLLVKLNIFFLILPQLKVEICYKDLYALVSELSVAVSDTVMTHR